jgi:exosortase
LTDPVANHPVSTNIPIEMIQQEEIDYPSTAAPSAQHPALGYLAKSLQTKSINQLWYGLVFIAMTLGAIWIVGDSLGDLWTIGSNDPESSQVLLVPVVWCWLAWEYRERLRSCRVSGQWLGVVVLAIGWALWQEGYAYQIRSFWHLGGVVVVVGTIFTVVGIEVAVALLPAWCALIFLVPIPGRLNSAASVPLEHLAATMTQSAAELLGMNVSLSGNQLSSNGVQIGIIEACSGLRLMCALFLACYVFAFSRPFVWWVRVSILIASPIVAVICNVIRLLPTVWMFAHSSASVAQQFHLFAGWAMLIVAFLLLVGTTALLEWLGIPTERRVRGCQSSETAAGTSHFGKGAAVAQ